MSTAQFTFKSLAVISVLAAFTLVASESTSVSLAADDAKIGVVDMNKALQTVDAGKKAKEALEKEINAKKKDLQTEQASIQKMTEDFKKQSLVLSDEARAKKQGEIQERIMKFQEKTQKSQMELQQREHELTEPIINKLRGIIGELAKSKGYTVILEKNEQNVLFSQEKDDLTSDIVTVYNKQSKS